MKKTDPAKEIADFCDQLANGASVRGDMYLGHVFGVAAWSPEFHQILAVYMERTELVLQTLIKIDIDEDHREELAGHITKLQNLCSLDVLSAKWNDRGGGLPLVKGPSRAAIGSLSPSIRTLISFPHLDDNERDEVLAQVDLILENLEKLQLSDRDFIRQALIDGLRQFRFRLARLKWLGWGYTIDGLRDVITAYLILEKEFPDASENTSAAAALKWTGGLFETVWKYSGYATGAKSRIDLALLAFDATRLAGPYVAGLITAGLLPHQ